MSEQLPRVVLDTVVLVQNLISGRGPSAACLEALRLGRFILLMSDRTLAELNNIATRPSLIKKYAIEPKQVAGFVQELESIALKIATPPQAFVLPRDPKDEPFIDLAVAGEAQWIVTWNARHLTYLMKQDTPEGKEFCARYPDIEIISPPELLIALR